MVKHLMYIPWTGLGLYGGFRGNRWLKNRIKVFKQFVVPSLKAQTNQDFILWCSWRPEEKRNPYVQELIHWLNINTTFVKVHTFHGVCFWDDKYPDLVARERLVTALHGSTVELLDVLGQCDEVLMTIQPSDDCYWKDAINDIQESIKTVDAVGYRHGYMMNYLTGELAEYNPETNPPFFTIKFSRDVFIDPLKHLNYTGPYKSHEFIGDKLRYKQIDKRGFIVGTHGENISTVFNHPYRGREIINWQDGHLVQMNKDLLLRAFGLENAGVIEIKTSIRRAVLRRLPHRVQRKLRYWFGELVWQKIYNFLRS